MPQKKTTPKSASRNTQQRDGKIIAVDAVRGVHRVELTVHLEERMKERNIDLADILEALRRTPTTMNLRADPPYRRVQWTKSRNRVLNVVFWPKADVLVIITAYWQ